ncbi:hypothetical protein ACX80E_06965 [Arthrobacter sp. TMN-49]
MTHQPAAPDAEPDSHRWIKKIWVMVLVGALAVAVWGVVQAVNTSPTGSEVGQAGTQSQAANPTGSAAAPATAGPTSTAGTTPSASPTAKPSAPAASKSAAAKPTAAAPTTPGSGPDLGKDAALAAVPQPVAAPVPLDKAVTVNPGLGVSVDNIAAVDGVAEGIGEIAGPAIRFTVVVANNSGKDLTTNNFAVTVEYGKDKIPAVQLSGPGTAAFPPVIANKQTASATFVFNVPLAQRQQVRILTSLNASSPIAAFEGAVSVSKGTP